MTDTFPFFSAPGVGPPRRLLLISFCFPPEPSVGALRWRKLARFAAERGWGLDVVTVHPSSLPAPDASALEDLPAGTRLYGVPHGPAALRSAATSGRALLNQVREGWYPTRGGLPSNSHPTARSAPARDDFVRRADVRWALTSQQGWRRAYFSLVEYLEQDRWARRAASLAGRVATAGGCVHKVLLSSGPPHMAHEAARAVSTATERPLVLDFRDPWSTTPWLPEAVATPLSLHLAAHYESRAIRRASLIVCVSEPTRRELARRYPSAAARMLTVMNGWDDDPTPPPNWGPTFTVAYAGGIYGGRTPRYLFRAAARVIHQLGLTPAQLHLALIGELTDGVGVSAEAIAREEGVEAFVSCGPLVPREQALRFLARAAVLVSLASDSEVTVPAKVFEYARFHAWLLACTRPDSDTALALRGTGADVVRPDDVEAIAAVLRARYDQWAGGDRPTPLAGAEHLSRRAQARTLFDAVEDCVERSSDRATPVHA